MLISDWSFTMSDSQSSESESFISVHTLDIFQILSIKTLIFTVQLLPCIPPIESEHWQLSYIIHINISLVGRKHIAAAVDIQCCLLGRVFWNWKSICSKKHPQKQRWHSLFSLGDMRASRFTDERICPLFTRLLLLRPPRPPHHRTIPATTRTS